MWWNHGEGGLVWGKGAGGETCLFVVEFEVRLVEVVSSVWVGMRGEFIIIEMYGDMMISYDYFPNERFLCEGLWKMCRCVCTKYCRYTSVESRLLLCGYDDC